MKARINLRRSLAWMSLGQLANFSMQFAAAVVLARHLSPVEMGVYAVAAATVGALSLIQAFGLQSLIVREPELSEPLLSTAFSVNALIAVGLSGGIFVASLFAGALYDNLAVGQVLRVLAVAPLFGIFEYLPSANIEREGRFRVMATASTLSSLAGTIVTIGLVLLGLRYMSIAYGQLVALAVSLAFYNILGRRHARFRLSVREWRRVSRFGLQMLAASSSSAIGKRLSELTLGKVTGLASLGLYNRASSLDGLIWGNIHMVIGRVVFVDFSAVVREGGSLRVSYLRTVDAVLGLLWPAFVGFAICAGPLINVIYGARWAEAARPLALLLVASTINVSITMTWEVFVASGQLTTQTRIEAVRAVGGTLLFVAACFISLEAAAATRIVDAILGYCLYRPHLARITGTSSAELTRLYCKNALITALAVTPAAAVMAFFHASAQTPIALLGASILLGVALWAGGLIATRHVLVESLRRVIAERRLKTKPS